MKTLNIIAVKTSTGYFATDNPVAESWNRHGLSGYLINGEYATKTFNINWMFIPEEPKTIEEMVHQPNINYRYELIDKSMASEKIPLLLSEDEATYLDDGDRVWREQYSIYKSLYAYKYDKQPDKKEPVDFTFKVVMEVDVIGDAPQFSYKTVKSFRESDTAITPRDITHQIIDTIIFPEMLLHTRPGKLTSKQSYRIIRAYVKDNIDPKYAEITSDYDFCFTVKKKVELAEPYEYTVDVNNTIFDKRKKRPKYVTRNKTTRNYTIFEMTSAEDNYKGYTPIAGFCGNSHEDLKKNIDEYLEKLITFINEPVYECKECGGTGVIYKTKMDNPK